jgi:phage-related protein
VALITPRLKVRFFKTDAGNEPVRKWLKSLSSEEKKTIGKDIKTVQFGWPIGMPLVRSLGEKLYETRSDVKDGIVRIFFTVDKDKMVLLHGIIKKGQKIPQKDIKLARKRLSVNRNKGGD